MPDELLVPRDAQAIIDVATRAATPKSLDPGGTYSVVVPEGASLELPNLEERLERPLRKRGHFRHFTGASLADYVVRHGDPGVALYADVERPGIVALLNGHVPNQELTAGWGDHRAELVLRLTPEWKRWLSRNGLIGSQVDFAEHLEDGLGEIVEPPAAEMLELAMTFQAHTKVAFRQGVVLASGQRELKWEEAIEAKAGDKGQLTVPKEFKLRLPLFEGGAHSYPLTARLRYRIREGALSIGYVLERPEDVLQAAFGDVVADVEATTELTAYRGWPPA